MKTKYDWSKASKNAKYIFTDQDGDVFESNCEPYCVVADGEQQGLILGGITVMWLNLKATGKTH